MTIAQWFSSEKIYGEGVFLYKKHGSSKKLLQLFESGETRFTRGKLEEELIKLVDEPNKTSALSVTAKSPLSPLVKRATPEPLRRIYDLKEISWKEMCSLHSSLTVLTSDNKRFEALIRIHELDQIVDECWFKIDYFNHHGQLPPEEGSKAITTVRDIVNLAKAIPTYISKIDKKLKDLKEDDTDPDLIERKVNWQLKLKELDELMDIKITQ